MKESTVEVSYKFDIECIYKNNKKTLYDIIQEHFLMYLQSLKMESNK